MRMMIMMIMIMMIMMIMMIIKSAASWRYQATIVMMSVLAIPGKDCGRSPLMMFTE
jgi:hypothetical protein